MDKKTVLTAIFFTKVAGIAQTVEQGPEKPCVRGSIPRPGTIFFITKLWQ